MTSPASTHRSFREPAQWHLAVRGCFRRPDSAFDSGTVGQASIASPDANRSCSTSTAVPPRSRCRHHSRYLFHRGVPTTTLSSPAVGITRPDPSTFPAGLAQALEPVLEHRFVANGREGPRHLLGGEARHQREELLERLARLVRPSELTERIGKAAPSWRIVRASLYGEARDLCGLDRKSTRLNSTHMQKSRMPSSA